MEKEIRALGSNSLESLNANVDGAVNYAMKQFGWPGTTYEEDRIIEHSLETFLSSSIDVMYDGLDAFLENVMFELQENKNVAEAVKIALTGIQDDFMKSYGLSHLDELPINEAQFDTFRDKVRETIMDARDNVE